MEKRCRVLELLDDELCFARADSGELERRWLANTATTRDALLPFNVCVISM